MKATLTLVGVLMLTAGCDGQSGTGGTQAQAGNISAEGKAQENTFSIKAPGVDIKLDLPMDDASGTNVDSDSDLIYPGASMAGVHIEGGKGGGAVELRFSSADSPDKLFAWYRDAARTEFTIEKAAQEGNEYVLTGRQKDNGDPFKIRLSPKSGGGTDGRLSVTDSN